MEIVIYWDSLLLLNVLLNYWILTLIKRRFSLYKRNITILGIALLGTVISFLFFSMKIKVYQFIETLITIPIMLYILIPKEKRLILKKAIGYGFLYSFMFAGILRVFFWKWKLLSSRDIHIGCVLTGGYICFQGIKNYLQKQKVEKKHSLCDVRLKTEQTTIQIKGMIDTGNSLIEPISKKPVCLVEEDVLQQLVAKENVLYRAIPYRSVGCEKGILYGVEIPEMQINYETEVLSLTRVICAGVNHKLSTKGTYQIIVHPECVREGKKESGMECC